MNLSKENDRVQHPLAGLLHYEVWLKYFYPILPDALLKLEGMTKKSAITYLQTFTDLTLQKQALMLLLLKHQDITTDDLLELRKHYNWHQFRPVHAIKSALIVGQITLAKRIRARSEPNIFTKESINEIAEIIVISHNEKTIDFYLEIFSKNHVAIINLLEYARYYPETYHYILLNPSALQYAIANNKCNYLHLTLVKNVLDTFKAFNQQYPIDNYMQIMLFLILCCLSNPQNYPQHQENIKLLWRQPEVQTFAKNKGFLYCDRQSNVFFQLSNLKQTNIHEPKPDAYAFT
jgi:hypothetical protein